MRARPRRTSRASAASPRPRSSGSTRASSTRRSCSASRRGSPTWGSCRTLSRPRASRRRACGCRRVRWRVAGRQTGIYPVGFPGRLAARRPHLAPPVRPLPRGARALRARRPRALHSRGGAAAGRARVLPARLRRQGRSWRFSRRACSRRVQDAGRAGHRRLGVSSAGPIDAPALAAANRAVGNPPDAAALECTMTGPVLAFLRTAALRRRRCGPGRGARAGRSRRVAGPARSGRPGAPGQRAALHRPALRLPGVRRLLGRDRRPRGARLARDRPAVGLRGPGGPRARRGPIAGGSRAAARRARPRDRRRRATRDRRPFVSCWARRPTTSTRTRSRASSERLAPRRDLGPRRLSPRGRAAAARRARRDPVRRHAAGLDPGPARRPADRDAAGRPDHRAATRRSRP